MDRPAFVARGSVRHVFASTTMAVLAVLGVAVLGVGVLIGPVGAALGLSTIGLLVWQWRRLPRRVLVVDGPGPDAAVRHGRDGTASVRLADVAGGVVQRTPGTTYRGWQTGADLERWLLVGHDGQPLGGVDGRGFSADDLAAARQRIGGTWMSVDEARARDLLPADAPWGMRRPRASVAVALAAVGVTLAAIVVVGIVVTWIGRPALLWPWW